MVPAAAWLRIRLEYHQRRIACGINHCGRATIPQRQHALSGREDRRRPDTSANQRRRPAAMLYAPSAIRVAIAQIARRLFCYQAMVFRARHARSSAASAPSPQFRHDLDRAGKFRRHESQLSVVTSRSNRPVAPPGCLLDLASLGLSTRQLREPARDASMQGPKPSR